MAVLSFSWKKAPRALPPATDSSSQDAQGRLLRAAIQLLPDAILIVERSTPSAPLRLLATNLAAQSLLRIRPQDETLVSVLRHPEILQAVDAALGHTEDQVLSCDTGGAQSHALRVWVRAIPETTLPAALIVLRDETEARRLERMRVDFMANASHELRTPLASISGFIETLQGHAREDAEARERFLEIMGGQARRMRRLIDDLLSLSRIELNEHVPPAGTCDLALIAREVADGLLPVLSSRGVTLEMTLPADGAAMALGDRDQIAQVVQNLLDNAVKYSPESAAICVRVTTDVAFDADSDSSQSALRDAGGGRMTLVAPQRPHEHVYVVLRVSDHGAGIAREHLPRLTERFYRVPGQRSGEIAGTGLGLAIVKHVTNRHRGGLAVESAPGMGTTFSVFVPATCPAS